MHVDPDAFSELHSDPQGALVHNLSVIDINKASSLAKDGYQQLLPILESGETRFNIYLGPEEHEVKAIFLISTVSHPGSRHSGSDIVGVYRPCCSQVLDEHIRPDIALVYNTYIRANRQTFSDSCLRRLTPTTTSLSCKGLCHSLSGTPEVQAVSPKYLSAEQNEARPQTQRNLRSGHIGHDCGDSSDCELEDDGSSNSSEILEPIEQDTERDTEGNIEKENEETTDKETENAKIAGLLVRQIQLGMKKMAQKKGAFEFLPVDVSNFLGESLKLRALFNDICTRINQIQARNSRRERGTAEDLDSLDNLFGIWEAEGKMIEQKGRREWKMWQWWLWYFKSCLRMILYSWRQMQRERKANGAYVMHLIINDLLATEGVSALAIIAALAEQAYYLSNFTDLSSKRLLKISAAVALKLRGKLTAPPPWYLIPTVVDWLSAVTKVSHRTLYDILECPNLSLFQLDTAEGNDDHLKFSREYAFLAGRWEAFAFMQDSLSHSIQMRGLQVWQSASDVQRFSMVMEEWLNQPQLPNGSEPQLPERTSYESGESTQRPSLPLISSSEFVNSRAHVRVGMRVAPAPNPPIRAVHEVDEIDDILAAAALHKMQHPATIPDTTQHSFARPCSEIAGHQPALEDTAQRNHITLGSGEVSGPAQAPDLAGSVDTTYIMESRGQVNGHPRNNLRRRYAPDPLLGDTEPPRKHSRSSLRNVTMSPSLPTTTIFLQEVLGEGIRQDVPNWDFLRDPDDWQDFDIFPPSPAGYMEPWIANPPPPVNDHPT